MRYSAVHVRLRVAVEQRGVHERCKGAAIRLGDGDISVHSGNECGEGSPRAAAAACVSVLGAGAPRSHRHSRKEANEPHDHGGGRERAIRIPAARGACHQSGATDGHHAFLHLCEPGADQRSKHGWTITAYGTNVTNACYITGQTANMNFWSAPAVYGVRIRKRFD